MYLVLWLYTQWNLIIHICTLEHYVVLHWLYYVSLVIKELGILSQLFLSILISLWFIIIPSFLILEILKHPW